MWKKTFKTIYQRHVSWDTPWTPCFVELRFWIQTNLSPKYKSVYSADYFDISCKVQYTLELYIYKHQLSLHSTNPGKFKSFHIDLRSDPLKII